MPPPRRLPLPVVRRAALAAGVLALAALYSACPRSEPNLQCEGTRPTCCWGCNADAGVKGVCDTDTGQWRCPEGAGDDFSCAPLRCGQYCGSGLSQVYIPEGCPPPGGWVVDDGGLTLDDGCFGDRDDVRTHLELTMAWRYGGTCSQDSDCVPVQAAIGCQTACTTGVLASRVTEFEQDRDELAAEVCGKLSPQCAATSFTCVPHDGGMCESGTCTLFFPGVTLGDGGCLTAADCPAATQQCRIRACALGRCGQALIPEGGSASTQVAGDCKRVICDATGATQEVNDDTDLPNDQNDCTTDSCTAGTPSHGDVASGATCSTGGGAVCDGNGNCVQCISVAQCTAVPGPRCSGNNRITAAAQCSGNACSYPETSTSCPNGCFGGTCNTQGLTGFGTPTATQNGTAVDLSTGQANSGSGVQVAAQTTAKGSVSTIVVRYSIDGGGTYSSVTMTRTGESGSYENWSALIPAQPALTTVDWHIEATPFTGSTLKSPATGNDYRYVVQF